MATYLTMVLVLLCAFGVFVARQARDQNEMARVSAKALAASAIRSKLDTLGRVTVDSAVWDEAYAKLTLDFDETWADGTFGVSVWHDLATKLQGAFLIDGYDRTRYGVWDGRRIDRPVSAYLGLGVRAMIDRARKAPGVVTGLMVVDGRPQFVAASAVRPTTAALDHPDQPRGVMIWIAPMDRDFTAAVERTYNLDHVRWERQPAAGAAQQPLTAVDGQPAGALVWEQATPGDLLLGRALLPAILLIAFCGLAGVWQARLTLDAGSMLAAEQERTAQASAEAAFLSAEASHDPLTGLLNRRGLVEAANRLSASALEKRQIVAAVVVDLDRFKPINDRHGHHVGDEALCEVAARLIKAVAPGDAVARLGGDEFVILTAPADRLILERLATRLIEALSFPFQSSAGAVQVGASVGMALAESDEEEINSLIRRADRAVFAAKQAGRAQWRLAA